MNQIRKKLVGLFPEGSAAAGRMADGMPLLNNPKESLAVLRHVLLEGLPLKERISAADVLEEGLELKKWDRREWRDLVAPVLGPEIAAIKDIREEMDAVCRLYDSVISANWINLHRETANLHPSANLRMHRSRAGLAEYVLLHAAISQLKAFGDGDRDLICAHFGLMGNKPTSIGKISKESGIPKSSVRRKLGTCLSLLRKRMLGDRQSFIGYGFDRTIVYPYEGVLSSLYLYRNARLYDDARPTMAELVGHIDEYATGTSIGVSGLELARILASKIMGINESGMVSYRPNMCDHDLRCAALGLSTSSLKLEIDAIKELEGAGLSSLSELAGISHADACKVLPGGKVTLLSEALAEYRLSLKGDGIGQGFDKSVSEAIVNKLSLKLPSAVPSRTHLLIEAGIYLVCDLVQKSEADLLAIPFVGRKMVEGIKQRLDEINLHLGMELSREVYEVAKEQGMARDDVRRMLAFHCKIAVAEANRYLIRKE